MAQTCVHEHCVRPHGLRFQILQISLPFASVSQREVFTQGFLPLPLSLPAPLPPRLPGDRERCLRPRSRERRLRDRERLALPGSGYSCRNTAACRLPGEVVDHGDDRLIEGLALAHRENEAQ